MLKRKLTVEERGGDRVLPQGGAVESIKSFGCKMCCQFGSKRVFVEYAVSFFCIEYRTISMFTLNNDILQPFLTDIQPFMFNCWRMVIETNFI